jgi:hypothetical protein
MLSVVSKTSAQSWLCENSEIEFADFDGIGEEERTARGASRASLGRASKSTSSKSLYRN